MSQYIDLSDIERSLRIMIDGMHALDEKLDKIVDAIPMFPFEEFEEINASLKSIAESLKKMAK